MPTVAELQARLDNLLAARAEGIRRVEFGDRRIEYRSDAEMIAAIGDLERQIARQCGAVPVRMVRFSTSKGL